MRLQRCMALNSCKLPEGRREESCELLVASIEKKQERRKAIFKNIAGNHKQVWLPSILKFRQQKIFITESQAETRVAVGQFFCSLDARQHRFHAHP
jgi:hypothetical protein